MSDILFGNEDPAATPLTPDERHDLRLTYITTRAQLNEAEQMGINDAEVWAFQRKRDVLDEAFLKRLHKRMLGKIWRWAGDFRTSERNIGVAPHVIGIEIRILLDDVCFWIANATYSPDEIALRFHHRLVWIHPFPNGNGRHGRLAADLLARNMGRERFSWGQANLVVPAETRAQYVAALKAADSHDIGPLLAFGRS